MIQGGDFTEGNNVLTYHLDYCDSCVFSQIYQIE